jgi:hypothetical protein
MKGFEPEPPPDTRGHSFNVKLDPRNVPEKRERGERVRRVRGRKGDGVDRRAPTVESHPLRHDF